MNTASAEPNRRAHALSQVPRPLLVFLWASILLTVASLLFSLVARRLGYGLPYSFAYYLSPGDRFADFGGFRSKFHNYGTAKFFTADGGFFMYPAPMVYVLGAFWVFQKKWATRIFLVFMLAVFAALIRAFHSILKKAGLHGPGLLLFVTGTVLLSYPMIFELMRWNIEVLIFLLTAAGIWTYWRDRCYLAAACFGVAAALKFFPLIFFGLLFARKRYRETAFGVAVAVCITLASLLALGPSIPQAFAWDNFQMSMFRTHYAGIASNIGYDHSAFAFIKVCMLPWSHDLTTWVTPYTRSIVVIGLALYFGRIWRMPALNQVLAISVLAITLTPVSYDYTLLSLYPALLLLALRAIEQAKRGLQDSFLIPYFLLFAVALTPLSFVVWNGGRYAAQARFLALVAILILALIRPLTSSPSDLTLVEAA